MKRVIRAAYEPENYEAIDRYGEYLFSGSKSKMIEYAKVHKNIDTITLYNEDDEEIQSWSRDGFLSELAPGTIQSSSDNNYSYYYSLVFDKDDYTLKNDWDRLVRLCQLIKSKEGKGPEDAVAYGLELYSEMSGIDVAADLTVDEYNDLLFELR